MCGICGFSGNGTRNDLLRMTQSLAHRGPDDEGFYIDDITHVHLGHRRLAIIDVAAGDQPMWNEDSKVGVIFNGEIYNHIELRNELISRGHHFASHHSDTEVLIHGYEEWGENLLLRLNGMFAFAIYDRRKKHLFLARDRFGEKPLYYCSKPGLFAFASELTSLAQHSHVSRSIDQTSLQTYFAWGYLPAPRAMLENTNKLPGGYSLKLEIDTGRISVKPYWQFILEPDTRLAATEEDSLIEECTFLLQQAAQRRLMSDVPLGVFLSGGLDSSLILSLLAKEKSLENLSTFTIGFDEPSFDESEPARIVAQYFGSRHFERVLDFETARKMIPTVLNKLDEPLGDASLLPTFLLSKFAREKVTVALSGDGGDELFAGYDPFLAIKPAAYYAKFMPQIAHSGLKRLVNLLPVGQNNMSLDFKLRQSLMGLSYQASMWLPVWMAPLDPKDIAELFETPVRLEELYAPAIDLWERDPTLSDTDRTLEFFSRFYLQDDILMKADRASMMSSLETRSVFLDNDLVDFCRRLPSQFKLRGRQRKYLLKQVAERLLPKKIVNRTKKGFGIPLTKWLKEMPELAAYGDFPGLKHSYIDQAFAAHYRGLAHNKLLIWCGLSALKFIDKVHMINVEK